MQLRGRARGEVSIGVIVAGVLFVLALLAVALYFLKFRGTVAVPEVVGLPWSQARDALIKAGLKPARENVPFTAGKPGIVSSQDPLGGSRRKPGTTITAAVPGGADMVTLPSLLGVSANAARSQMRRLGLEYVEQGRKPDPRRAGTIVDQDPKGGAEILKGTAVNFYISTGAQLRKVPELVGKSREAAEDDALRNGFVIEVTNEVSRVGARAGDVIDQVPPARSLMDPTGTIIKVSLCSAARDRAPRITGLALEDARELCRELDMDVRVEEGADEKGQIVVRQDPGPGAPVFAGIAVKTDGALRVPELVGESLQDAYDIADNAGIRLSVSEVTGEGEPGVIVSQAKPAGTPVTAKPRMTIRVEIVRMKPPKPAARPPKESKR